MVLLLGMASAAAGADLTISSAVTTPVTTSNASNGPGNITVASGGSVTVTSGAAATVDSSNTLNNAGTLTSSAASNGIGVAITGNVATTLTNTGTISATGTGSGNIGLLVSGGPVTGSISFGNTGGVSVTGDKATGVLLAAPFTGDVSLNSISVGGTGSTAVAVTGALTGNLALSGTVSTGGGGGNGLLIAAPVSGAIVSGATISSGTTRSTDSSGNIVAGLIGVAGARISANVGQGFVNDRYYVDSNGVRVPTAQVDTTKDTLVTGSVVGTGTAPALWVAADATNPQAITLGAYGSGDDGFAVINRGTIVQYAGNPGLAATAIRIGGTGATATLTGGIANQQSGAITVTSIDATAAGLTVSANGVVPAFVNAGTVSVGATQTAASGTAAAGPGGAAYGVSVEAGGTLNAVTNSGSIVASATGPGQAAAAIIDKSGTLTSITNSGTLTAVRSDLTVSARAIDLTGSSAAVTVSNSGTVNGDIAFGTGFSTLNATAGAINGKVAFGSAGGLLAMSGTGVVTSLANAGPLDVTLAGGAKLSLVGGTASLNSISASGNSLLVLPVGPGGTALTVAGAASFTGQSQIRLSVQSLAVQQNITIIQANGGFSTDHLSTLVDASQAPYLFTASPVTATATALQISLTRKTAAEVGFTPGVAPIYDQSIPAFANDTVVSAAIANLPNQAAVFGAYSQILPPSFTRAPLRLAQSFADTGFGAGAARLVALRETPPSDVPAGGFWLQEYGDRLTQSTGASERGYRGWSFGVAGGYDWQFNPNLIAGIGLVTQFATMKLDNGTGNNETPFSNDTYGLEGHVSWTRGKLFVQGNAVAGYVSYKSDRSVAFGGIADTISAKWHGWVYGAGVTAGANFDVGRLRITPQNTLSYVRLQQNAYTETGGGSLDLAVDSRSASLPTDTLRLVVDYGIPAGEGRVHIEGRAAYVHQFSADPVKVSARYLSGGDPFTLVGDAISSGQADFGAGVHYDAPGFRLAVNYDRRSGNGFIDQAASLTARFLF